MRNRVDRRRNELVVAALVLSLWHAPATFGCVPVGGFCPCEFCELLGLTNGAERGSAPEQVSMDGNLQYSTGALSFPDTAGGGTFYLTYCNQPVDTGAVIEEGFGYNWIASIPRMEPRPNGQMWVLLGGRTSTRFVSNGPGAWNGADGIRATISTVTDGGESCYCLTGTNGSKSYFYAAGLESGQLKRIATPAPVPNTWFHRTYHYSYGRLWCMIGQDGLTWVFTYLTGGDPNAGKTQSIVVYKHFGDQQLQTELARVEFEYCDAADAHGTLGDLKYMRLKKRTGSDYPTAVTYFRYYRGVGDEPPPHNVKFIVGPASYEHLLLAAGSPGAVEALPDDGTGSLTASGNFDYRVEYDQLQRVTELLVGWGATCGCSGSGTPGTHVYSDYQTRPDAQYYGYDWPVKGVTRTNPDGSQTYIETNKVGAVVTEVHVAGEKKWATRYVYNSSAERTAVWHPSACDAESYVYPSWTGVPVGIKDAGRIDLAAYDTRGRIVSRSVKNGSQGTPATLEEFEYSDVLANGGGRYVYEHTVYYGEYPDRVASATTAYSYEFFLDDIDHLKKVTTVHPDVTKLISQTNVTSSVEHDLVVENLEAFLVTESTDEEGVKTRTHRDYETGLTVKQIADYGQDRLNLTTAWQYDDYGSATAITTPAGRKTRFGYSYLLAGSVGGVSYPRRLVMLTHDHVDAVRTGMSHVTVEDLEGRVLESADAFCPAGDTNVDDDFNPGTAAAPVLTLEEAFVAGQLCNRKSIEYTGGLKTREYEWTDAENAGAARHVTEYGYDTTGELVRIEDRTGTIRGFVRDACGRIVEVRVGTDDTEGAGNMVAVETRVYDWSDVALKDGIGDGLLTKVTSQVNDTEERVVRYGYDFRGRRTWRAMRTTGQDNWPWPWDVMQYELDLQGRELTRASSWAAFSGIWDSGSWVEVHSDTMPQRVWKYALESRHDERGRVYEERSQWTSMKTTPAPEPGKQYKRTTWHDTRGLVVKRREPGEAWTKLEYDGAGRQIAAYHAFDSGENDGDYADAKSVAGDTVVKEQRRLYDGDGAVILQSTYERKADDADCPAGALSAALSYCAKNYVGTWYDEAGRVKTVVDYGDNGGANMTERAVDPPARSDTALRTDYAYHFGTDGSPLVYSGQPANTSWVMRTDPAEKNDVQVFDNLSRSIREVRNHQDGTPSTTNSDSIDYQNDITTAVEYDAAGRVSKRIAFDYAAGLSVVQQVTSYVYGVTLSDAPVASALCSNELVRAAKYGQGTGEPYAQEILLSYNRLGQRTSRSARDCATGAYRTKRSFKFDNLGRLLADSADEIDAGVDGAVRSIGYTYDSAHRMAEVRSYSDVNRSGTVLNAVTRAYTKEGNLEQSLQDHGGGWSKAVDYAYADDGGEFPTMRLSRIDYPILGTLRRQVEFTRDGLSELLPDNQRKDWVLGRVSKIADQRGTETAGQVLYTYMSAGSAVRARYGLGAYYSDLEFLDGESPEALGFDRFGRVKRLRAKRGATTMLDYTYGYNRLHSPTARTDAGTVFRSETFAYDDAGRLVKFHSEDSTYDLRWNLTAAGNWRQVKDYMYYTNLDVREHNAQNEISRHQVRVSGSFVDVKPEVNLSADSYDIEGNLRETAADNAQQMDHQFAMVYDAWNRLVKVRKGTAPPVAHYARDGLGRIIVNQASNEHWYYDGWRLVSVLDDDLVDDGLVKEYVWGVRYIDEIASTVSYSGSAVRRYHLQDANWNVVLTLDSGAVDQEAIMYDPYGKPEFWIKAGSYFRYGDLTSPYGTDVLFQGRSYACLSANFPGGTRYLRLYDFRHRAYSPALGRFLQRDPIGVWTDDASLGNAYTFEADAPVMQVDPYGLLSGRTGLSGRGGWSMTVDESCHQPCCSFTSEDGNLERLLSKVFAELDNMNLGITPDVRECVKDKMKGGKLRLVCHSKAKNSAKECEDEDPTDRTYAFVKKPWFFKEGEANVIHVCCDAFVRSRRATITARHQEHELVTTLVHELVHLCGGKHRNDGSDVIERTWSPGLGGYIPTPPICTGEYTLPNPYEIEKKLTETVDKALERGDYVEDPVHKGRLYPKEP